jgi:hypothetical protein
VKKLLLVLILLTGAVAVQDTKWAPIPKANTTALWMCVGLSLIAYFVLRSGWGQPWTHAAEQRALGTTSNSYYEPRREWILNGFTIAGGIVGAMWWGATSWLTLVRGLERKADAHGLVNLQAAVIVGILSGGIIGAAVGLYVGEMWERTHRRARSKVTS